MMRWFIRCCAPLVAAFALASCGSAPSPVATESQRLTAHIAILSADDMEGRGAGYPGERRAADYIAAEFANAGLAPLNGSYFQAFEFRPVGGVEPFQRFPSRNVLGFLRGSTRPDEIVVIGAHYDGQGMIGQVREGRLGEAGAGDDHIWNSASDNATSVAALIELARSLAHAPRRPERSIVFVAFSGEENRLNGAFAYVRRPPLPWRQHVAMINLEKLVGHEPTTFITATSGTTPRFAAIAAQAATASGVTARDFHAGLVTDTDHFAFNIAGLPALVIGTGAYEHVHRHDDVRETLQLDNLPQRVSYIRAFLRALADDADPLPFTGNLTAYSGIAGGPATASELATCSLTGPAFVVTAMARVEAAQSDLRLGDVIVSANNAPLTFGEEGANFLEDATRARGAVRVQIQCGANRRDAHINLAASPE